jgi:protein-disulfide isomerase
MLIYSTNSLSFAETKKSAWITEFRKKDVDLSGLDKKSLHMVLKIFNENDCACGCKEGSLASCLKHDSRCGYSRAIAREIVAQAKRGKSEEYLTGLLAGYFLFRKRKNSLARKDDNRIYTVKPGNSPWKGAENAPITIVEFTDFQCPFCARVLSTIEQIMRAYPNQIKFYVKNNPLPFHKNAQFAALASLAAAKQGKYWEMHDILFKNYKMLAKEKILGYAKEIGLDMEQFKKSLESKELKDQIEADKLQAIRLNARGTPAFFINGRKLGGARPFSAFKAIIDEELAKLKDKKSH